MTSARGARPTLLFALALVATGVACSKSLTGSSVTNTPTGPSTAATYSVSGIVKTTITGVPVEAATVTVLDGPSTGTTASSNAAGSYALTKIQVGTMTIKITAANFHTSQQTVTVMGDTILNVTLTVASSVSANPPAGTPLVRGIYLVPSDVTENQDVAPRLVNGLRGLQSWYRDQLGNGKTFSFDPTIQTYHTSHPANWYQGDGSTFGFFYQGYADAHAIVGYPDADLAIYVDADLACGQTGAGAIGALVLHANDIRTLTGRATKPTCPGDTSSVDRYCREIGGLGHELGHTFGLHHPADQNPQSLMGMAYLTYPKAILEPADLAILNQSRLFVTFSAGATPYCY